MSYYSEKKYAEKNNLWFENFCFKRWFHIGMAPILDIGCATGNFVATHPDIIEGIDIDPDSLKIAKERGLKVKHLDAKDLGLLSGEYYGGVFAKQVIEHLDNPLDFMKNIYRILKPGGKAVILTPNCPWALKIFFWDDYSHRRPLTKISLAMLAMDAGFSKHKIVMEFRSFLGLGFLFRKFRLNPNAVAKIQNFFGIKSLAIILIAEK